MESDYLNTIGQVLLEIWVDLHLLTANEYDFVIPTQQYLQGVSKITNFTHFT